MLIKIAILSTLLSCIVAYNRQNNACSNLYVYPIRAFSSECYYDPDVESTTANIILRAGYNLETYEVITDDGYILKIHRIRPVHPNPFGPIFLEHGTFASSSAWLLLGSKSYPFQLADAGFDVWIGNLRATTYSSEHISLSNTDKTYWDFNLDALAKNDLVAQLKWVLSNTGRKVIFVGRSLGATISFILGSENPDLAAQLINGVLAIDPEVYFKQPPQVKILSKLIPNAKKALNQAHIYGFRFTQVTRNHLANVCANIPYICLFVLNRIGGEFKGQFPSERLLNFVHKFPDSMSVESVIHLLQFLVNNEFKAFDYGRKQNIEKYGVEVPPKFDLGNFKLPVAIFYGKNDHFVDEEAILRLFNELGSVDKSITKTPSDNEEFQFNHFDFLLSTRIQERFYPDFFKAIEHLSQQKEAPK